MFRHLVAMIVFGWMIASLAQAPACGDCEFSMCGMPIEPVKMTAEEIRKELVSGPQKITRTISGITFDSAYDNGSLGSIVAGSNSNNFDATLYSEPGTISASRYWFRFRMTGAAGRTVTINLEHTQSPRPWFRHGDGPWTQMNATQAPTTSSMVLAIPAGTASTELAFWYPYGFQETIDAVMQRIDGRDDTTIEVIGQSTQGRDIHMVTVTDPRYPKDRKERIWVHTRAHSGEVTSTHTMLGFLDQVLEDSPTGARLRRFGIFHIVPQLNVDGVFMGMTRWSTTGNDLERMWCPPGTPGVHPTEPEVFAIKAQVDRFMASDNPIRVALNLHSTAGQNWLDTFFFNHNAGANNVTAAYSQYQRDFIEHLRNTSVTFDNRNPQTSNLQPCIFIESYFYNNWQGAVMAITHEGHYARRWYDNQYATDFDKWEVGGGMARAIIPFLQIPEPLRELDAWVVE